MLPYNKRSKADGSSNSGGGDDGGDDLGDETLVAKNSVKAEALARARSKSRLAETPDEPKRGRLFQNSLSEDDVTRLMPSKPDVTADLDRISKPTMNEFRSRPAAGRRADRSSSPVMDDELATNVFDQPRAKKRAVLAAPAKSTLFEPVPNFGDSDERPTVTNEADSERMPFGDSAERAALQAAEADERARKAPAAFARVEPAGNTTAPHPFAPRPATPMSAAHSGPQLPPAPMSDARVEPTTVTGERPAVAEGRSMGAWAVAFAAVLLLAAGGAFAALRNPASGGEVAASLIDPMSKPVAAQAEPAPVQATQPVAPVLQVQAPAPQAQAPVAQQPASTPPPAAPVLAVAPTADPAPAAVPSASAKGGSAHHTSAAPLAPPPAKAAPAPKAPPAAAVAAAPAPPKPAKEPKKGKEGMSDEEKKLSDEAKALADKQLQQSL